MALLVARMVRCDGRGWGGGRDGASGAKEELATVMAARFSGRAESGLGKIDFLTMARRVRAGEREQLQG